MSVKNNGEISFLGTGWSFPPSFSASGKDLVMTKDEEDIHSSLDILLSTTIGERFLQPLYGCNLENYVFEALSASIETEIKLTVKNAISMFESRIKLLSIKLDTALIIEGRIDIVIEYTIIITNSRFNYVYPFYQNEAMNKSV